MKYFLWLVRIVVGVLFIFSGLVKANDPLGLVYKMKEFFEVLHMNFMEPYAFAFSIAMIAFEILCGMAVLLGFAFRVFSVLLLLLNMLFTFLTAYAWFTGTVKECGCFGACIKISNSATFYKDVVLLVLSIFLFAMRKRVHPLLPKYPNTAIIILTAFFAFGSQWWALEHLPYYDCLAYKPGNNLWQEMQIPPGATPAVYESVMIYEKDGVKKEFTTQNYPWQDSTWKFVDRKDKLIKEATGEPLVRDFTLTDYDGNDHTQEILTAKGYTFLLFVRDANSARADNMDRLHNIITEARKQNINFYVVTSSDKKDAMALQQKWNMPGIDFLQLDATVTKTVMRSNPGLMLIKDSVITNKWSYRDYPKSISMQNGKLELQ